MKLMSVDAFLERSNLQSLSPIVTAAGYALEAATEQLKPVLYAHEFSYGTYTDFFEFRRYQRWLGTPVRILLRCGFLDTDEDITVKQSRSLQDWGSAETLSVAGTDTTRGMLYLDIPPDEGFLRVTYSAGLATSEDDSSVYADVPDWLTELAYAVARDLYFAGQDSNSVFDISAYQELIALHRRWSGMALRPILET